MNCEFHNLYNRSAGGLNLQSIPVDTGSSERKKCILSFILVLILSPFLGSLNEVISFLGGPAFLDAEPRQPVRVLIMETEPWGYRSDETGEIQGIWPDIAMALFEGIDRGYTLEMAPYARVWRNLEFGLADVSFLIRSADREQMASIHLFDFQSIVISRAGIEIKQYDDLYGLRIGLLRGVRLNPVFDSDDELKVMYLRNYEIPVSMLNIGRLDAVAGNSVSLDYLINSDIAISSRFVLQTTPVYIHFSVDSTQRELIPLLQRRVNELKRRGFMEEVIRKHTENGPGSVRG